MLIVAYSIGRKNGFLYLNNFMQSEMRLWFRIFSAVFIPFYFIFFFLSFCMCFLNITYRLFFKFSKILCKSYRIVTPFIILNDHSYFSYYSFSCLFPKYTHDQKFTEKSKSKHIFYIILNILFALVKNMFNKFLMRGTQIIHF